MDKGARARSIYILKILYQLYQSLILQGFALYHELYQNCTRLYQKTVPQKNRTDDGGLT